MAVPSTVAKQMEGLEGIEAEAYAVAPNPTEGTPQSETPPVTSEVPGETPAAETTPTPGSSTEDDTWKHRFDVLQGKYNAEVPRLSQIIRDLEGKLQFLAGQMESLKKPAETPPATTKDPLDEHVELLRKTYPDLAAGIEKLMELKTAKANATPDVVESLNEKIENLSTAVRAKDERELYTNLQTAIPNWAAINTSPEFVQWLQEKDRYVDFSRHQLLLSAFQNLDTQKVINFFSDFLEERQPEGATSPASGANPPATPITKTSAVVSPPSSSSQRSAPPASNAPATGKISKATIDKFYLDVALGRLKLTPEQKMAKENEFIRAVQEGRVVE